MADVITKASDTEISVTKSMTTRISLATLVAQKNFIESKISLLNEQLNDLISKIAEAKSLGVQEAVAVPGDVIAEPSPVIPVIPEG